MRQSNTKNSQLTTMSKLQSAPQACAFPLRPLPLSQRPVMLTKIKNDLAIVDNEISNVLAKSKDSMHLGNEELLQWYLLYYVHREANSSNFELFHNHLCLTLNTP